MRTYLYVVLTALIILSAAGSIGLSWQSSPSVHTNLGLVATVLALAMGLGGLVRFIARRDAKFLFIGVGFLGTAALDALHTVVGTSYWQPFGPVSLQNALPITWNSSQAFLAAMLLISSGVGEHGQVAGGDAPRFRLQLGVAAFVLGCCYVLALVPFGSGLAASPVAGRLLGAWAAMLLLIALYTFLGKGGWREDRFDYWLVASLFVFCGSQLLFMARPDPLFDAMFDMAHVLKIGAYALVLTGVLSNGYQLFLQADRQLEALARLNEKLRGEVAHREAAEMALRVSEERFALALQGSDEGLWDWPDTAQPAQWWSPRFYSLLGYQPGELEPSQTTFLRRLLDPADYAQIRAVMNDHLENGKPFDVEYRLHTKQAGPRWFRARAMTFRNGTPGPVRMVGTLIDIHEGRLASAKIVRQAEELRIANEELEQFAYSASHDLQEPLRNLIAYCGVLREDLGPALGEDATRDLHYIADAAKRMKNLVEGLLALSRAGLTDLTKTPVDIEECVRHSLDNLRQQILESGAKICWENLPVVAGDQPMLTQVYQNLLSNAMKFRGGDPPEISLTAQPENGRWVLGVHDNGIGLESQHCEMIFSPFQRLHTMAEYAGSGIGLAICRKTVERHGGQIWVESEPGHGAHFKFALPAAAPGGSLVS